MAHKRRKLYKSGSKVVENSFLRDLTKEQLEQKIKEEAYLGILANDSTLANPLLDIPMIAHDNFSEYLVYLMGRPEYFYFMIRVLFGMETFPMQAMILKELYEHRFPILLASRGASKSFSLGMYILIRMISTPGIKCVITGAGFRQAKLVFDVMESIWNKAPMLRNCFKGPKNGPTHGTDAWHFRLGESICYALPVGHDGSKIRGYRANCVDKNTLIQTDIGLVKISDYLSMDSYRVLNINNQLELPEKIYKTEPTDVYEVKTANGYSLRCSNQHRLLTTNGKKTEWKYAKDLQTTDYLEMDNNDYFPDKYIEKDGVKIDENMGFLLGVLISEGTVTNRNYIGISHTNKEFIDEIISKFKDFNWKIVEKEPYTDPRGWKCKKSYYIKYSNVKFRETLKFLGLDYNDALKKEIPWCILQSPRSVIVEFLKGMFLGDGSCFKYTQKGKMHVGITYYSSSETLINQVQTLLLKFNITGSKNGRYTKISGNINYMLAMRGEQAFKLFNVVQNKYWEEHIIKDGYEFKRSIKTRMNGNSYVAETTRCDKNIYIGSYKDKESAENAVIKYWENVRPVMRVRSVELLSEKEALYDFVMPDTESFLGGGFVNHNCLICDEFSTVNPTIFEEVMSGFLSVNSDSIAQIKERAFISTKKKLKLNIYDQDKNSDIIQNQLILSGTTYYKHNHFYTYFNKWRKIISSRGDFESIKEFFPEGEDKENLNWKDYSVIRIPVDLIQAGHMDMAQIGRIKASVNKDIWLREFCTVFSDDSDGFFKRSLIQACSLSKENQITKGGEEIKFSPAIYGRQSKKHIFGVDPAYQGDNFAIVILEINGTHRRVVHCWTTQASDHKQRLKDKIITENNYYKYCVRKIRDLMKRFPCAYIALDKGGGGDAIKEAFTETLGLLPGEEAIYPIIDPTEKPQDTDFMQGEHILHIIKFSSDWVTQANHALKKDMETRDIIFPYHDDVSYVEAEFYDQSMGEAGQLYDTLEDCMSEIEELKNELSTIAISETASGKEHFDTPDKKTAGMKKGRLRKDRYSALLMANMVARDAENLVVRQFATTENIMDGYFSKQKENTAFLGNGPIADKLNALYCD